MNYDEFSFVNQQLAAMLQDGIPLEGTLRQLCQSMHRGALRTEFQNLEADLARGLPLTEALAARELPELYVQMIQVGVAGNNLPGMLTLLADYYQRLQSVWTRLKGLMVYPVIVLLTSLGVSLLLSFIYHQLRQGLWRDFLGGHREPVVTSVLYWVAPVALTVLVVAVVAALAIPGIRRWLQWRLPAFQEVNLARIAWATALMLQGGCPLPDAIGLLLQLERDTPAGKDLSLWQARLASGVKKFPDVAVGSTVFPPLFVWIIGGAGEDVAAGFRRAAEIYHNRAAYRVDMLLYAALPVSVVLLGSLVLTQGAGLFIPLIQVVGQLGS